MTWPESFPGEFEYRTLILAPTGNDARLALEFMQSSHVLGLVTANVAHLCEKILAGCGAILVAEEVLSPPAVTQLFGLLQKQPAWSDIPVILVTTGGVAGADRVRRLAAYGSNGNVAILERPFRPSTLVSVVEAALRARRRQYEVRRLLSELKHARDAAEQASRAKDDFLAALSHELRTPLNPVLLLASEHAADNSLPGPVRKDFEQMARQINLEARLIDDLLDLTRITRGKLSLELKPLDAHEALREALATTGAEIAEKKLGVNLRLEAEQFGIAADSVRLQQVFWNVLKNAAKFTPSGGRIAVETFNENGDFVVRIADSGVGMDETEISNVFEAFVQGSHARPDSGHRFGGLGLGLAISRMLIKAHGGEISAGSQGRGQGSIFTLRFPLVVANESNRPVPARIDRDTRQVADIAPRILLVEDHEATRVALSRLLRRRNFQVTTAGSVSEARRALLDATFDLLVSDVGLADGTGYQLMESLRDTPIIGIALSGYGMESDVAKSQEAGFSRHLTKPVSVQTLESALEAAINSRRIAADAGHPEVQSAG